jgi:hypothetical protein
MLTPESRATERPNSAGHAPREPTSGGPPRVCEGDAAAELFQTPRLRITVGEVGNAKSRLSCRSQRYDGKPVAACEKPRVSWTIDGQVPIPSGEVPDEQREWFSRWLG